MENPLRGILLLVGATFLFSVGDVFAKILGERVPVFEIGWLRYVVFVAVMLVLNGRGGRRVFRVRSVTNQLVRGALLVASMMFFVFALRHMALADAASVGFVAPLFITALSVPLLGEVVGVRRWIAILVGLVGVLVVIRPGTGAFQPAALLVLMSSASWAYASVLTRRMAASEDTRATLLWSAVSGLVLLSLVAPFVWVWPSWTDLGLNLMLGIVASAGQWLMVQAYRYAGASVLAPFTYVQLIWSVSMGYLVFGTLPDEMTGVGAAIIVASGMYTVHRERVRARERAESV